MFRNYFRLSRKFQITKVLGTIFISFPTFGVYVRCMYFVMKIILNDCFSQKVLNSLLLC